MPKMVWICLLTFAGFSAAATETPADTVYLEKHERWDTLENGERFLQFQRIYIETNRKAKDYAWISDFSMNPADTNWYSEYFRENKIVLKKVDTRGLPRQWLPLYPYKDRYYLYNPCDGNMLDAWEINESLLTGRGMEPVPFPLESIQKIDYNTYSIRSINLNSKPQVQGINIYFIDQEKGIAIWEIKTGTSVRYGLYVPKEKMRNFDIIVNHTSEKYGEFEFDEPDISRLLGSRKQPG
jgi:hypothetical protein